MVEKIPEANRLFFTEVSLAIGHAVAVSSSRRDVGYQRKHVFLLQVTLFGG